MQTRNISAGFSVAENQVKLPFSFPHFDESRQDEIEMQICSLIVLKKKKFNLKRTLKLHHEIAGV